MADPLTMALGMMAAGTAVSASGTLASGRQAQQAANFEAEQLRARGDASLASASRDAMEERRQSRLAQSRALAVSAASGGGAADKAIADLAGEGEYRALSALWQGGEARTSDRTAATAARFEGKSARRASRISAFGTVLGGAGQVGSLYGKYGGA